MVKKGVKRKFCDGGDQVELSRGARKKLSVRNKVGETFQNGEDSEQAVKEFIKLVNMKETRLKGERNLSICTYESGRLKLSEPDYLGYSVEVRPLSQIVTIPCSFSQGLVG